MPGGKLFPWACLGVWQSAGPGQASSLSVIACAEELSGGGTAPRTSCAGPRSHSSIAFASGLATFCFEPFIIEISFRREPGSNIGRFRACLHPEYRLIGSKLKELLC